MNKNNETINSNKRLVSLTKDGGSKCWIAKQVCEIFGIENADQVIANLDAEEKFVIESDAIPVFLKSNQDGLNDSEPNEITLVNEYGFVTLMYLSQTELAKADRRCFIDKVRAGLPYMFKFAPLSFHVSDEGVSN